MCVCVVSALFLVLVGGEEWCWKGGSGFGVG